jgi:hypothetical protein
MSQTHISEIVDGLKAGHIIPYLGAGALKGSINTKTGSAIPADSNSLILAMNNGQPMAPKLMYEFPRAAMNLELKKGRTFVTRFLQDLYGTQTWTRAPVHEWISDLKPHYIVDINRDTQLQESYASIPHTLVTGVARIGGTDYRFKIFHYNGSSYQAISQEQVNETIPVLFKPMGTPVPESNFIASDADYVDYITELMGGFAIPSFLKAYRKNRQYLFIGLRLNRDSERMVMSDITYDSNSKRGWALIPEPSKKEVRFCNRIGVEIIEQNIDILLPDQGEIAVDNDVSAVGC